MFLGTEVVVFAGFPTKTVDPLPDGGNMLNLMLRNGMFGYGFFSFIF